MYYIYGISGPSLLIESTDSMIYTYIQYKAYLTLAGDVTEKFNTVVVAVSHNWSILLTFPVSCPYLGQQRV